MAGQNAGLNVLGYTSQAWFLLNLGLAERMAEASLAERSLAQRLINEHEMGELFKVIGFSTSTDWSAQALPGVTARTACKRYPGKLCCVGSLWCFWP